jgi:hypothetical protein
VGVHRIGSTPRAEAIPIAAELVPYLKVAMKASPSGLLFPDAEGKMLSRHTPLEDVLRRALAHAGIVEGWEHVCRKRGCGHSELVSDDKLRHCPRHGMKLWPKARVQRIRFHDLRHTTASLLMMAGVNPGAVQRILRHSDPRITTETYGHLVPDYLRSEIDRLHTDAAPAEEPSNGSHSSAGFSPPLLTTFLHGNRSEPSGPSNWAAISESSSELASAGWTGLEDGAGGELDRAEVNPASGIGHLRVVGGAADEPDGAQVRLGCHTVTRLPEGAREHVREMLEGALEGWRDRPSVGDLRRRLHRLLVELDEGRSDW